ncbi:hypothetical protein GCM10009721_10340 [Terrabacter tumescens]|uniref:Calcineurin-like phosphoesterase domain-containing protein n=1 Tax=Terrabacter tumescens TaxID=60443 RepID=A0ABQ2HNZ3_9MICO|nr:hypothetical protein [Terrabacter tumescens]GGM87376.1 hypothetical protein GCM10009721_10340 [Terrabacter tumescens]
MTDPDLPADFDGLRVALVTDLHVGPVRDVTFTRRVVDMLRNENVTLTRGSASIRLAGIHDETGTGVDAPNLEQALSGVPADAFTLLAAHQPKAAESGQGRGVDLQLSGHTHGGQLWPFRYAVLLQQPVVDGLDAVGDVPVLTSRGAGAWGPPVRVLAPPQIPVITLHAGAGAP